MLASLASTAGMMAFVALIGPVSRQLGLSEWQAGLSVTAAGVFWMLSARGWGRRSDRIGRRRVMLTGLGCFALVYLVLALFIDHRLASPGAAWLNVLVLVAARGLIGLFYAALPVAISALVADHHEPAQRASTLARIGAANAVGLVIGPATAGWAAGFGLAWPLYAAALLPSIAWLLLRFVLPASVDHAPRRTATTGAGRFDLRLLLPALAAFTAMFSIAIAQVVVGFVALDRLHLDEQAGARVAGHALTAVGVSLILAQTLVFKLPKVAPLQWILVGAAIAAVGFAAAAAGSSQFALIAAYANMALGMGMVFPAFQALAANAVGPDEQGAAAGTVAAAQGLGIICGPLAGGLLYQSYPRLPYGLAAGLLLMLALIALHRLAFASKSPVDDGIAAAPRDGGP